MAIEIGRNRRRVRVGNPASKLYVRNPQSKLAISPSEIVHDLSIRVGPRGPAGEPGPPGPRGPSGDAPFIWLQEIPQSVWIIEHELGYDPTAFVLLDNDGNVIDGFGIQYYTPGQTVRLTHDVPVAGQARIR